jgi:ABC-type arginine/histidine transport system permease subunit
VKKHPTVTKHPTTKTVTPPPAKPATQHVAAPKIVGDAKSQSLTSLVLTLLLLVVGLVLGGSAAVPTRYAPASVQRFYAAPDRRVVALAAATAILMGFGVSFYLS